MLYNQAVRRLLAIAIVLLLGLPTVAPLFALGTGADPNLPACCRRDGKHHCMLEMSGMTSSASSKSQLKTVMLTERCPYGSKSLPGTPHPDWSLSTSAAIFAGVVAHPSVAPQTESQLRVSEDRSRQKRGPPSIARS